MEKIAKCKVCKGTNLIFISGGVLCVDCETMHYEKRGGGVDFNFYPLTRENFRNETFK